MSAYVVDFSTITKIVRHIERQHMAKSNCSYQIDRILMEAGYDLDDKEESFRLASDLLAMNVAAVNQRYLEDEKPEPFKWESATLPLGKFGHVYAYKALRCLLYQCSEGNVPEWPLYEAIDDIANMLACDVVESSEDYELAPYR